MKRAAGAVATLIAIAVFAAQTMAAPPNNGYEGRAEHDPYTYVGFDVQKSHGVTKVAKVTAQLSYACRNGVNGGLTFGKASGKLRVKSNKRFSGELRVPASSIVLRGSSPFSKVSYEVTGKLGKHGKAHGTIDAEFTFAGLFIRGGDLPTRCYSGELDWKAKRGADAPLPTTTRSDGLR